VSSFFYYLIQNNIDMLLTNCTSATKPDPAANSNPLYINTT